MVAAQRLFSLNNQFFYYARQYRVAHPELTRAFRADEDTFEEFRSFAQERDFEYISEAEAHVNELEEMAQEDDFDELEDSIAQLIEKIDSAEEKHWQDNKDLILWRLTYAILEKAYGVHQAESYNAEVDPQVLEARALLANPLDYEHWFQVEEIGIGSEDAVAQDDESIDVE